MDRLRQRADFLAAAKGPRATAAAFVLQCRPRDDQGPVRVGFTVSRKVGTATERNRVRRRLRELVTRVDTLSMRPHSDYVLVGRRTALSRDFQTMLDDLRTALKRLRSTKPNIAFSSEVDPGSLATNAKRLRGENAPNTKTDRNQPD